MYYLNKIVGFFSSPLVLAVAAGFVGTAFLVRGRRSVGLGVVVGSLIWVWAWSTGAMYRVVGMGLERSWPIVLAEDSPSADAIVLLGGGIGSNTNVYPYAEISSGSDRVWHAARLYKAGKAPIIIAAGQEGRAAHLPLLVDLGVPEDAIVFEAKSRNTEENARFVLSILRGEAFSHEEGEDNEGHRTSNSNLRSPKPKVLLVTSVWHMRRAKFMFERYAPELEVIPAPTDYEATVGTGHPFSLAELLPNADMLSSNTRYLKEYIGYWGYRLFRF